MTPAQLQPLRCLLEERGLGHWHDVAVDYACRWDGWRAHNCVDDTLSPDHEPLRQVMDAIRSLPPLVAPNGEVDRRGARERELACADALARVAMTAWHAMLDLTVPYAWSPLEQPFLHFRQTRGRLVTWNDDAKRLWAPCVIRTWLLGRMKEHELSFAVSEA